MTNEEFTNFYIFWKPQIVRYMGWKTRRYDDAEDLAQKLFVGLLAMRESLRLDTADHYMWKCAQWVAFSSFKEKKPLLFNPTYDDSIDTRSARLSRCIYNRLAAQALVEQAALNDRRLDAFDLDEQLAHLSEREREVIAWTLLEDHTLASYARTHAISAERVSQIQTTGLRKLRAKLCLS